MEQTTEPSLIRKPVRIFGWLAAWVWTFVAGIGGLGLLITQGPLPVTNGWFALFSGISVCPLTAWLVKRKAGITLSGWTRFAIAFLYRARPPGLENGRARHVPDRPVTMLERRLLLISVARPNTPAISSSHWQLESPTAPSPALRR